MNKPARIVAALLFAGALGVTLALPMIRGEGLTVARGKHGPKPHKSRPPVPFPSPTPTPRIEPTKRPVPSPPPQPSPSATSALDFVEVAGPFRHMKLANPYPAECLGPKSKPKATGLLAGFNGTTAAREGRKGRLTVRAIGGGGSATFDTVAPIAWSPSGRYLATGRGMIITRDGTEVGRYEGSWGWSPGADCILISPDEGGTFEVGTPEGDATVLLEANVRGFSISPDGVHAGLTIANGARADDLWMADLRSGEVREVDRAPHDLWNVFLGPWSRDGRRLFYWRPDGVLRSVGTSTPVDRDVYAPSGNPSAGEMDAADPDGLVECGDELIGVVGDDRRLAVLRPDAAPRVLTTSHDFSYSNPQCSPDGSYLAALRKPVGGGLNAAGQLVVLDRSGNLLQELTPEGSKDANPMWGPAGTGLLYVRSTGTGTAEVWFAREGSSPETTGLELSDDYAPYVRKFGWESLLDWSATPPTGRVAD